jgi:hypothetical protein
MATRCAFSLTFSITQRGASLRTPGAAVKGLETVAGEVPCRCNGTAVATRSGLTGRAPTAGKTLPSNVTTWGVQGWHAGCVGVAGVAVASMDTLARMVVMVSTLRGLL